jgi:hypothetical protein
MNVPTPGHQRYERELRKRGWITMTGEPVYPRQPLSGELFAFVDWVGLSIGAGDAYRISFTVRT